MGEGVGLGVGRGVGDGVGEAVGLGVGLGVGEGVGDGVGDGVGGKHVLLRSMRCAAHPVHVKALLSHVTHGELQALQCSPDVL